MARMSLAEFHAEQQKRSAAAPGLQENSKRLSLAEWHARNLEKEKREKELAESAAKATAAPAPVASSSVLTPEERARRIAEGIPLSAEEADASVRTGPEESTLGFLERQSREYGDAISNFPRHFNTASAQLLGSAAKVAYMPPAAALDALRGDTRATDYAARELVKPILDIADAGALREDATFADQLSAAGAGLVRDIPLYMATGGAAPAVTATTKMAPYLSGIAAQTFRGSLVPSVAQGEQTAAEVMARGGSAAEAYKAGLAETGTTIASNILPANVASRATTAVRRGLSRGVQGAGTNLVSDIAATEAVNPFLPAGMKRDPYDPENAAISTLLGAPMGAVLGERSAPQGAALARAHLQNAGAFADNSKPPPPIVPPVGGATTPPATTQKAPVAPPTQPKKVYQAAATLAALKVAEDIKADPTLGVPDADRPKTLIERRAAYEAIEQA